MLRSAVAAAVCGVCGRRAHPPRLRLTLAKLGAVLPIELMLHAAVLQDPYRMGYLAVETLVAAKQGRTPPPRVFVASRR